MKIKISDINSLSIRILGNLGLTKEEAKYCTELFLEAELCGKSSHGFDRLIKLNNMIGDGRVKVSQNKDIEIKKQTDQTILVDGKEKTGFYVVPKTLDLAMDRLKDSKSNIVASGVYNTTPAAGMIGYYARKAAEEDLIYIGFHNSMSYLVPFGAKKGLFGTNPVTIGVPSSDLPVIWDCSSSKISVGDVVMKKRAGEELEEGIGLDKEGNTTIDPKKVLRGGILPFASYKGSGMAMMVELLAGALVDSSIIEQNQWKWGAFFILIHPGAFRDIEEFKNEVDETIESLKNLPKKEEVEEIYFPGEKSGKLRRQQLKSGFVEIPDGVYKEMEELT